MFSSIRKLTGSGKSLKNSDHPDLYTEYHHPGFGDLKNRVVMAAMTRARATTEGIVGEPQIEYYVQRSNAGLMITECVAISQQGYGWWCVPNIYEKKHVDAWRQVTDAVHEAGGKIICQIWHAGRASHSDFQKDNQPCVAASAIKIDEDGVYVPGGEKKEHEVPRALETAEIPGIIREFAQAAKNAMEAGFDGVELHGANGYLIDNFLQSCSNVRTDKYGGSVEKRMTFLKELLTAVTKAIPREKVGLKLSPNGIYNGMGSEDNTETFTRAIEIAAGFHLAHIDVMDGLAFGFHKKTEAFTIEKVHEIIDRVQKGKRVTSIIANCGYTKETGEKVVKDKVADMVAYARPYIGNPDLVRRFKENIELVDAPFTSWYGNNGPEPKKGYSDFPVAN